PKSEKIKFQFFFFKKVTKSGSEWALGKNVYFFHPKSEKIQIQYISSKKSQSPILNGDLEK
ncbi:hypothetical protein NDU88_000333, partial [Pleurodeles waltl]